MTTSQHLENVITKHNRISSIQVVFIDVEKYSQRRTLAQIDVIDAFTKAIGDALKSVGKEYIDYFQTNNINLQNDIMLLPTGDGAAIVFSFEGVHDMHLYFALELLRETHKRNEIDSCEKFKENGWCNCHASYNVRIGVSEGKGIVFKDINGNYNAAGSVLNMAARVMGLADGNQIIFTEEAYHQIVDMVDDPNLIDHFVKYDQVPVKHGVKLNVYQYTDHGVGYINSNPVGDLLLKQKADDVMKRLSTMGIPTPSDALLKMDKKGAIDILERICSTMTETSRLLYPDAVTDVEPINKIK